MDYVFPDPAGPEGAHPKCIFNALVTVIHHLSVKGVTIILGAAPIY